MLKVKTVTTCCENYRGKGTWASWRESSQTHVSGVERVGEEVDTYEGIYDADAVEGKVAYILSITYSTGDSFGNASGCHKVLGVFTDKHQAKVAKGIVESCFDEFNDSGVYEFEFDYTDANGEVKTAKVHNPAAGFFENKQSVDLEGFVIM